MQPQEHSFWLRYTTDFLNLLRAHVVAAVDQTIVMPSWDQLALHLHCEQQRVPSKGRHCDRPVTEEVVKALHSMGLSWGEWLALQEPAALLKLLKTKAGGCTHLTPEVILSALLHQDSVPLQPIPQHLALTQRALIKAARYLLTATVSPPLRRRSKRESEGEASSLL